MEEVPVPEWGGTVFIGLMSAEVRDDLEQDMLFMRNDKKKVKNLRSHFVAACACDEQGNKLFTPDDVDALGKKSAKALDRLFEVSQRINAMSDEEIEGMEKNSVSM
jgi:hypothetical protein